jgi:hypothetical protein
MVAYFSYTPFRSEIREGRSMTAIEAKAAGLESVTFDPKPIKAGHSWGFVVTLPNGKRDTVTGSNTESDADFWLEGAGCRTWLSHRGYTRNAPPSHFAGDVTKPRTRF